MKLMRFDHNPGSRTHCCLRFTAQVVGPITGQGFVQDQLSEYRNTKKAGHDDSLNNKILVRTWSGHNNAHSASFDLGRVDREREFTEWHIRPKS